MMAAPLFWACGSDVSSASLESDDQKASYTIGRDLGSQLKPASEFIDMAAFRRGIEDAFADRESAVPQSEMGAIMQAFGQRVRESEQQQFNVDKERNASEGSAYLAENGQKSGVTTTASGLQYEVLRAAEGGRRPAAGDRVQIHYEGKLIDGTVFDSSYERATPATFGVNDVIPGFSEGLMLMEVGSKYRFVIPGDIGYGEAGSGPVIGPNATLIFEVELLDIPG